MILRSLKCLLQETKGVHLTQGEWLLRHIGAVSTRGPMERRPPPKREIVGSIPTVCVQHIIFFTEH